MRLLYNPLFILCCVLFIVHQVFQKTWMIPIPLADAYLDNLVAVPILLTLLVVERRILFKRGANYTLSALEAAMATMVIAVVSEVLFPFLSSDSIFDWVDLLLYAIGGLIFYYGINKQNVTANR